MVRSAWDGPNPFGATPTQLRKNLLGSQGKRYGFLQGMEGTAGAKHRRAVAGALRDNRWMAKRADGSESRGTLAAYKKGMQARKRLALGSGSGGRSGAPTGHRDWTRHGKGGRFSG